MTNSINPSYRRTERELASDCRIDQEDARQIVETVLEDFGSLKTHRRPVADLMRRCAPRMDGQAFEVFKSAFKGEYSPGPDRVLLKPGSRGSDVHKLRAALTAASRVLKDRRIDPGPGDKFDARAIVALQAFQAWWNQPTRSHLDSNGLMLLNMVLRESDHPQLDLERPEKTPKGISLHFYPGEQKMLVLQHGQEIKRYDMRGGPKEKRPDPRPGNHVWGPTPRGVYKIRSMGKHVSRTWKNSQIPWGARIRENQGVIQFQVKDSAPWKNATGPDSIFKNRAEHLQFKPENFISNGKVIETWEKNDFGHLTVYLQQNGKPQNHMIHATPSGERRYADDTFGLKESHGCEHLRPADLDEAVARGYLREGVRFVVHGYDEKLKPAYE